jgi:hypothetical protein
MPVEIRFTKRSQNDLRRISSNLRKHGNKKAIRKSFTDGMKLATKPAVRAAKDGALRLPSRQGRGRLRRQIAASTSTQVRTRGRDAGVNVRVSRARMGEKAALPKLMNQGSWRRRVYGRDVWVQQTSRAGWFESSIRRSEPRARKEVHKVLNDIEKKVNR